MISDQYSKRFPEFAKANQSFGTVAVLYGGTSAERAVSLRSGKAVADGLRAAGIDVVECDIGTDAVGQLKALDFDRAFIVLHGAGGEDGKMQALLDLMGKPYTGSRHTASALAMDKLITKQIWISMGLPTPKYRVVNVQSNVEEVLEFLGGEAFVKPVHEGSSIGMFCATSVDQLSHAINEAGKLDDIVIAESRVVGPEFSVPVLNGYALPPIGLKVSNEFYDYEAKYESDETIYECPCDLPDEKVTELRALAQKAFDAVGCTGWGRVDVMQNESGEFYLLEVNTVPGMTDHSLVPMAAKVAGVSFSELVCEVLMTSVGSE